VRLLKKRFLPLEDSATAAAAGTSSDAAGGTAAAASPGSAPTAPQLPIDGGDGADDTTEAIQLDECYE
jgi:hypothetical protein